MKEKMGNDCLMGTVVFWGGGDGNVLELEYLSVLIIIRTTSNGHKHPECTEHSELYIFKWLKWQILCSVNFTSINLKK